MHNDATIVCGKKGDALVGLQFSEPIKMLIITTTQDVFRKMWF